MRTQATLSRWLVETLFGCTYSKFCGRRALHAVPWFFSLLECNETKAALLPDLVRGVRLSVFVYSEGSAMWPDSLSCCAEQVPVEDRRRRGAYLTLATAKCLSSLSLTVVAGRRALAQFHGMWTDDDQKSGLFFCFTSRHAAALSCFSDGSNFLQTGGMDGKINETQ